MEDVSRDAFDYFLDLETGEVMTISVDVLEKAEDSLYKTDDEPITDEKEAEEFDMPEWAEKEVELAIKIFSDESRPLQQVLGRIADQRKLRKDGQGTPGPLGLLRGIQNYVGVVREVTDDGIDLAESNFH